MRRASSSGPMPHSVTYTGAPTGSTTRPIPPAVVLAARREQAEVVPERRHDVGLVDRARQRDAVAEVGDGPLAEPAEPVDDRRVRPSAVGCGPPGRREVMKRDAGEHPAVVAGVDHAAVMVEGRLRELTFFGFDARPLDREPVGAEAEVGEEREV